MYCLVFIIKMRGLCIYKLCLKFVEYNFYYVDN